MIIDKVLNSIDIVIKNAKHIKVNFDAIKSFVNDVNPEEINNADIKGEKSLPSNMSYEEHIAYAVINGTLQFCFWGNPEKWTIEIEGEKYDGSEALIRSIKRAVIEGMDILSPKYLSNISDDDVKKIFRGNPEIPFIKERGEMLQKLGNLIMNKYDGLFGNIIIYTNGDVNMIVENLVNQLPEVFDDSVEYYGNKVHFYKRVQILASYLYQLYKTNVIPHKMFGKEGLAGLADYRAPQILRSLCILEYDSYLENLIDNKIEILSGSNEEVEIRAFTLKAEHEVALALKQKISEINDSLAHRILWFRCQKTKFERPYHLTKTIWY